MAMLFEGIAENFNDTYSYYNIYVIGVGGTGSQLLPLLYQRFGSDESKSVSITLLDGDSVEKKNMKNQRFVTSEIGLPKALVLSRRYSTLYKKVKSSYVDTYLMSSQNLLALIDEDIASSTEGAKKTLTILIGCVDNNATREILDEVFGLTTHPVVYIDSGNGTDSRCGQSIIGVNTPMSYQKPVCALHPEILDDKETIDKALSCQAVAGEAPQNIATNAMAAMVIFNVINNLALTGEITAHEIIFDCELLLVRTSRKATRY